MKKHLCLFGLLLIGSALVQGADFQIDVVRLSPKVAVFYGDPWDNAIVALATAKGIIVVDAPFSKTIARGFREAIQTEFKRSDFLYLINTHEHYCHVGGNAVFADVPIVGHDSLRREMLTWVNNPKRNATLREIGEREVAKIRERFLRTDPKLLQDPGFINYETGWKLIQADLRENPAPVPPTITFDKGMTLHLGETTVRLIHYGHAHSIADTLVSIPEENLVLTAGVFYPTHVPELNTVTDESTPAEIDNGFSVMHGLLNGADDSTKFLASHYRAVMNKSQVQQYVSYLEGVWNGVRQARTEGKTLAQAQSEILLKDFPEIAKLPNEMLRGTEWENLDIHRQNIAHYWKVLGGTVPAPAEPLPGKAGEARTTRPSEPPPHAYVIPGKPSAVFQDQAAVLVLARQMEKDLTADLEKCDIQDKGALQRIHTDLYRIAVLKSDRSAALRHLDRVRGLQENPAGQLLTGVIIIPYLQAHDQPADDFHATFRALLSKRLATMPYPDVQSALRAMKDNLKTASRAQLVSSIETGLDPLATDGNLGQTLAEGLLSAAMNLEIILPLKDDVTAVLEDWLKAGEPTRR